MLPRRFLLAPKFCALVAITVVFVWAGAAGAQPKSWTPPAALNTNAATDSGADLNPQVTTDGLGTWVAVWESGEDLGGILGTDVDILVARSTDNGHSWSAPAPLNTNAATDTGFDYSPQLTTDGLGSWVAVWKSTEDLAGALGTDLDIFVARAVSQELVGGIAELPAEPSAPLEVGGSSGLDAGALAAIAAGAAAGAVALGGAAWYVRRRVGK